MENQIPQESKIIENTKLIYILYLVSMAFGITAIIGVVMVYINKDDPMPDWLKSHYDFLLSTFWKGMIMLVVGILTIIIIVGIPILVFFTVWTIIRCVKGMRRIDLNQAQPEPDGWMFD